MTVQINGKVKDRLEVSTDIQEGDAETLALQSSKIVSELGGNKPKKVIVRAPKLVNVVI